MSHRKRCEAFSRGENGAPVCSRSRQGFASGAATSDSWRVRLQKFVTAFRDEVGQHLLIEKHSLVSRRANRQEPGSQGR